MNIALWILILASCLLEGCDAAWSTIPAFQLDSYCLRKRRGSNFSRDNSALAVQNNLNGDGQKDDLFEYFDPRISPHMYPGGIQKSNGKPGLKASADEIKTMNEVVKRIGILLIDHGSKREASNDHLKQLAQAYQRHPKCPPHFIVGAAHMEIALPNIEQGIRNLILQDAG